MDDLYMSDHSEDDSKSDIEESIFCEDDSVFISLNENKLCQEDNFDPFDFEPLPVDECVFEQPKYKTFEENLAWAKPNYLDKDLYVDDFDLDEPIPCRVKSKSFNEDEDDVVFQLTDITIEKDEVYENSDGEQQKQVAVYLNGNLENGETVCVNFKGYKPFFYLSIPEEGTTKTHNKWRDELLADMAASKDFPLPAKELLSSRVIYKLPTTGYRGFGSINNPQGVPLPFIHFKFHTLNAFYRYKQFLEKTFPPPTELDIKNGNYKNNVMLCEAKKVPHDIKFANYYGFMFCGWLKLSKGTYSDISLDGKDRTMHSFSATFLESVEDDTIANELIDSFDIEAIRFDETEAMPEALNPLDCTATIGHAMETTNRVGPRRYYVFMWGSEGIDIPEYDRKGFPLPKRKVIIKNYKTEASMLTHWVRWRRSKAISPDCSIGWNIFGFDLGFLATRIRILTGIDEDVKDWGRIVGYETKIKEANIESKAIAHNKYSLTPASGNMFVDSLIVFQRDVTLRLPDYQLKTVSKNFLGTVKDDVHYSEIKGLFFGTAAERGLLVAYNLQDCDLVLDLFFFCAHWPKLVNVCRVNRVPINVLCPRGQQIRVFGGFHKNAIDNGFIIYRHHYLPILDKPIVEDPSLLTEESIKESKRAEKNFEKKQSVDDLMDYWIKTLNLSKTRPVISMLTVNDDGKSVEKIMDDGVRGLGYVPVKDSDKIKIYGRDVNPFSKAKEVKKEETQFFGRNGQTIEEIIKSSRSRPKRKFVQTESGKMKAVTIVGKNKKGKDGDQSETEKGFAGGYVMAPKPGFYENIPIVDFNALYPNIMMSYCLDPALMVLEQRYVNVLFNSRFANCPGVTYLKIRFNHNREFLFAQVPNGGVMIKHTKSLVTNRKLAQGIMKTFETRITYLRKALIRILGLSSELKFDEVEKKSKEYCEKFAGNGNCFKDVEENYTDFIQAEMDLVSDTLLSETEFMNESNPLKSFYQKGSEAIKGRRTDAFQGISEITKIVDETKEEKIKQILKIAAKNITSFSEKINKEKELSIGNSKDENNSSIVKTILQQAKDWQADITNYNSKQNELKVGSNSTFGFLGAGGKISFHSETGHVVHKAMHQVMGVSAAVTLIGRKTIETAKDWVETTYPGAVVIYADTDSLFIFFPENIIPKGIEGLIKTFKIAPECANGISKLFSFPGSTMRIVHEKTARFLIMYGAKCYALDKFEKAPPEDVGKLEIKGLSFSKRDCCKFVTKICNSALDLILRKGDLEGAKDYVKQKLNEFVEEQTAMEDLKIYKKISRNVLDIARKWLANPKECRDVNGRLQNPVAHALLAAYLFIDLGLDSREKKNEKAFKKHNVKCGEGFIEEYDYVLEQKLKIDRLWYLNNQCMSSITTVFGPLMTDPKILLKDAINEQERRQVGMKKGTTIHHQMRDLMAQLNGNSSVDAVERPTKKTRIIEDYEML